MTDLARRIHVLGAGRMGQGIAQAFAFAGVPVTLIDVKNRPPAEFTTLRTNIHRSLRREADIKVRLGRITPGQADELVGRIAVRSAPQAQAELTRANFVFEAVPEVMDLKRRVLGWLDGHIPGDCTIASTTSTFLVTELSALVSNPDRFLNAHWLNPADVVPLVEISRGPNTGDGTVQAAKALLEGIGKVPVVCSASAGYIVPRLQALAMNEAARMVEEGVATAGEIDKAVRVGFGFRFAVLGMLEFIDWGGGDTLHYAGQYLADQHGARYAAPDVIAENMAAGRNGLRDGKGFYEYDPATVDDYKLERLRAFWQQLDSSSLAPGFNAALDPRAAAKSFVSDRRLNM